ncbi:MAG TPA: serine hydrolase domain-containing protein [Pirellulaceae bacterium]|nr:serine hydrolase domain-containing protein [Pirellulaceae bacterium]
MHDSVCAVREGRRHMTLVVAVCLILAAHQRGEAQTPSLAEARASDEYTAAIAEARSVIGTAMHDGGIPGLSIAVGIAGRTVWSEGFGWADVEQKVPVTTLTMFRVGSVAKAMTAAALGLLVERRQIDLDAPVQTYVPEFPPKPWPITLREVAGHTAGIRHYAGREFYSAVRHPDVESSLAIFAADSLLFEPGTDYSYSTYGFTLVSAAIEGSTGRDFLAFMRDEVFEPLGLRHTVADHRDSIVVGRAAFYEQNEEGVLINAPYVDSSAKWAGGGFLSTPEDMVLFGQGHLSPGFLKAETLALLQTSQWTRNGERTGYGLGWFDGTQEDGDRVISHAGSSVGGSTLLLLVPERDLVVAGVINLTGAVRLVVEQVADIFERHVQASR